MNNRLFQTIVLSTALVLAGASDALAAKKPTRVQGAMKGTMTLSPTNLTGGVYMLRVDTVGSLSHLGRTEAVWQGDVSVDAATLQPTPLTGLGWTLTTKQGGSLQGTLTWSAAGVANRTLVYSLTGTFTITGGTGRLRGSTGQGTVTGTIDAASGKVRIHLDALVNTLRSKKLKA